jgi:hypothetical protein
MLVISAAMLALGVAVALGIVGLGSARRAPSRSDCRWLLVGSPLRLSPRSPRSSPSMPAPPARRPAADS